MDLLHRSDFANSKELRPRLFTGSKASDCCRIGPCEFLGRNTTCSAGTKLAYDIGIENRAHAAMFRIEESDLEMHFVLGGCVCLVTNCSQRLGRRRQDVQHHQIGLTALTRYIDRFIEGEFSKGISNGIQCQVHIEDLGDFCFREIKRGHRCT